MAMTGPAIQSLLVPESDQAQARGWWRNGKWKALGHRLLIDGFDQSHLKPAGYDLSVGYEYLSLWDPSENSRRISDGDTIRIAPGETVLILTKEFLGLPTTLHAHVVPRALLAAHGLSVQPQHVEPTWFGKLIVACSNQSSQDITLEPGLRLCTCVFDECSGDEPKSLRDSEHDVDVGLGREHLKPLVLPQRYPRQPLKKVNVDVLEDIARRYGHPWDAVPLLSGRLREELTEHCNTDLFHRITEDVKTHVVERQAADYGRLIRGFTLAMVTLTGTIVGAVGGWVYYILSRP